MKDHLAFFKEHLKKIDIPFTREHKKIVDTVFDIHEHFTEEKPTALLASAGIDQESVTETLQLMVEAGLIRRISFKDSLYYEQVYGHAHHDHLICISCGKVVPFVNSTIEEEQLLIAKKNDFELTRHTLQIEGICSDCQADSKKATILLDQKEDKIDKKGPVLPLSMIDPGTTVEVVKISGGKNTVQKLLSLGISTGNTIEVLSNNFQGPFIIKIENSRIGIGHGLCHKIMVKQI
jgi:Fur family ferric uptake transcriptional regulator